MIVLSLLAQLTIAQPQTVVPTWFACPGQVDISSTTTGYHSGWSPAPVTRQVRLAFAEMSGGQLHCHYADDPRGQGDLMVLERPVPHETPHCVAQPTGFSCTPPRRQ